MKYELNIKPLQLRQPKMYDYYMSTCDFYYLRYEDCEIPMFKFAFEEMIKNPKKTDEYKKIFIDIYNETFLQPNTDSQKLQMFLDYLSPKFIDVRNINEAARAAANALKAWRYVIFDAQWYADNVFIDDKITPPKPIKITLPKIDDTKFDAKWIFDTYVNKVFKCSEECFNSWLKDGKQHPETIDFVLEGRQGKPAIAQLRKFIEKITGDAENTKDTYYKTVFGLEIKTAQLRTATNLNNTFKELKNYKLPNKPV